MSLSQMLQLVFYIHSRCKCFFFYVISLEHHLHLAFIWRCLPVVFNDYYYPFLHLKESRKDDGRLENLCGKSLQSCKEAPEMVSPALWCHVMTATRLSSFSVVCLSLIWHFIDPPSPHVVHSKKCHPVETLYLSSNFFGVWPHFSGPTGWLEIANLLHTHTKAVDKRGCVWVEHGTQALEMF